MNKKKFFRLLIKEAKKLIPDEVDNLIHTYESKFDEQLNNGLKEKEILKSFGEPKNIVKQYIEEINSHEVTLNENLNVPFDYSSDDTNNNEIVDDSVVEVNPNLDIEVSDTSDDTDDTKEDETEEKVEEQEIKKIPSFLIPLWLILVLLVFVLVIVFSILYTPLFFSLVLGIVYSLYSIAGGVIQIISIEIFSGIFQIGISILLATLSVFLICLLNLAIKHAWLSLIKMMKRIGGRKNEKKI